MKAHVKLGLDKRTNGLKNGKEPRNPTEQIGKTKSPIWIGLPCLLVRLQRLHNSGKFTRFCIPAFKARFGKKSNFFS